MDETQIMPVIPLNKFTSLVSKERLEWTSMTANLESYTVGEIYIEKVGKKTPNNCEIVLAKVRQLTFVTVLNFYISTQYI